MVFPYLLVILVRQNLSVEESGEEVQENRNETTGNLVAWKFLKIIAHI